MQVLNERQDRYWSRRVVCRASMRRTGRLRIKPRLRYWRTLRNRCGRRGRGCRLRNWRKRRRCSSPCRRVNRQVDDP